VDPIWELEGDPWELDADGGTRDMQAAIRTTIRALALQGLQSACLPTELTLDAHIAASVPAPVQPPPCAVEAPAQEVGVPAEPMVPPVLASAVTVVESSDDDNEAEFTGMFSDSGSECYSDDFGSDSSDFSTKRPKRGAKKVGRRVKKGPAKRSKRSLVIADDVGPIGSAAPAYFEAFRRHDLLSMDAWCFRWKALCAAR
jgi:hypothetical protein